MKTVGRASCAKHDAEAHISKRRPNFFIMGYTLSVSVEDKSYPQQVTQVLQADGLTMLSQRPSRAYIYCRVLPVISRFLVLYLCLCDGSLVILYLGGINAVPFVSCFTTTTDGVRNPDLLRHASMARPRSNELSKPRGRGWG
jgi:hypothetical protein